MPAVAVSLYADLQQDENVARPVRSKFVFRLLDQLSRGFAKKVVRLVVAILQRRMRARK
jgi:hypothetical protein